jgi:CrcB protein
MTAVYIILIGLAGGLGSVLRLFLASWIGKLPWGILTANTVASFVMGSTLMAIQANPMMSAIIVTGICGGLSTFSTFSAQTVEYFKAKQVWRGVLNFVLNFTLPALAALGGLFLFYSLLK